MTKSNDSTITKVGLYVFLGLVLFVATVLILGGNQFVFKPQISLKTKLTQAQGLGEGSLISLAGIPIGYVTVLEMAEDSASVIVNFDIDKTFQERLTTDAIASVKTQGALGDRYIYINPSPTGTILQDGDFLTADNKPGFLDAISERTSDFKNVGEVIRELSVFMKNLNANDRSALLMENLTHASKNIKGLTNNDDLINSLKHLSSVLKKVDEGDGTLGRLINDPGMHDRLMQLMGDSPRNRYLKPLIQNSIRHGTEASK